MDNEELKGLKAAFIFIVVGIIAIAILNFLH